MQNINLPIGTSDFAEIRRESWYYVDKTGLISDLLNTRKSKVTLVTRPRRFGKTLGMNMLANFFDISKDSKALFKGLEVSKDQKLCEQWMNQYPTLFLSFKDVDGLCFEDAFDLLKFTLSQFYIDHNELGESNAVDRTMKQQFYAVKTKTASAEEIKTALLTLMKMMQAHYGKPVILLLDDLPEACEAALEQIEDRRYAESFWDNYNEKLRYGIAFYKKRCLVGRRT